MSDKSATTKMLARQLARGDNAKERMVPLKKMCWENGVMVEYELELKWLDVIMQRNRWFH
jgi:hypothetical protein